jgi:hypothetical protein
MLGFDAVPSGRWIDPSFPDVGTVTPINIASTLVWLKASRRRLFGDPVLLFRLVDGREMQHS